MTEILRWYSHWAALDPVHPALIHGNTVISYAELWRQVTGDAQRLNALEPGPGTRLLLDVPPASVNWIIELLAGWAAGAEVILPDPHWPERERQSCLSGLKPYAKLGGEPGARSNSVAQMAAGNRGRPSRNPGVWLFTSGTTARPKPRYRPASLMARMVDRVRGRLPCGLTNGRPVGLCVVPLYHGFGLVNALLLVHSLGGTVVLGHESSPEGMIRLMQEQAVQMFFGWPSHFQLLDQPALWRKRGATRLSWCVSSSSRLDPSLAARFAEYSGCPVRQQYGTTETGPLCLDSEIPPTQMPDCVGTPLEDIEIQMHDNGNRPLRPGLEGRLAVRIHGAPIPQLPLAADGFYYPGDVGHRDEAGRIFVRRRLRPFYDERKTG